MRPPADTLHLLRRRSTHYVNSWDFPPAGNIQVSYQRRGSGIDATITLPGKLAGEFVCYGSTQQLHLGVNHILLPAR